MKLKTVNKIFILFFIHYFSFCQITHAQSLAEADKLFSEKKYNAALIAYLEVYETNKTNVDVNYRIALCHIYLPSNRLKSIPYLEFVTKQTSFDKQALFYLAKMYQVQYKFDLAINTYNKFIAVASGKTGDKAYREIETCRNAIIATKQPVDVTLENLGKDINSPFDDFNPFITSNESLLAFSSNRKGTFANVVTPDMQFNTDVFFCEVKSGKWQKAKNAGEDFNSQFNEICSSISNNAEFAIVRVEKSFEDGNLNFGSLKNKKNLKLTEFKSPINTSSIEKSAYITSDSLTLIFSSNRLGGFGGLDLWMSKKLPTGEWGIPTNLGPTVNTKFNEDFPSSPDNLQSLFFASEGHNSMGGYDIYKTNFDVPTNKWEAAKNVGYPINTPDDNYTISFSSNKKNAYVSYDDPKGQGGLDICKITYNEIEHNKSLINGKLTIPKDKVDITETIIDVFNKKDQELIGTYKVKFNGSFYIILAPGEYILNVELDGYVPYSETIQILDKVDFKENIDKTITLQKK